MNKQEKETLKNTEFILRLINYTHSNTDFRIHEALRDSDSDKDKDFSEDFMEICATIVEASKKNAN